MSRILLSVPHVGIAEQRYIEEAFASNQLSTVGSHLDAFENEFSHYMGLNSVALASGSAAIHLGLRLLGVGPAMKFSVPRLLLSPRPIPSPISVQSRSFWIPKRPRGIWILKFSPKLWRERHKSIDFPKL